MTANKKKLPNAGVFFMIAAMFLVLGFLVSRGFLAIGFIFLLIGLTSIGRPRVRFYDGDGEEIENDAEEDGG
jgi:hypothetical protein